MRGFRWPPPPDGGPRTWGPGPTGPRTGRPTLPTPPTDLVRTPGGIRLERLVSGVGDPVTVFGHGLAGGGSSGGDGVDGAAGGLGGLGGRSRGCWGGKSKSTVG